MHRSCYENAQVYLLYKKWEKARNRKSDAGLIRRGHRFLFIDCETKTVRKIFASESIFVVHQLVDVELI